MLPARSRSIIAIAATAATFAALLSGDAHAAAIHGQVVNGTTGSPDVSATVALIEPSAGMAPIRTVQATNGKFSIEKLTPGVYMARIEYDGVTYSESFQIAGDEHLNVTIAVYETTSSWDGVEVVVPHFTAARHDDHLVIERVYDINNQRQPFKTITGEDGFFRFSLPAEMHEFNAMYIQYGDVPIQRPPIETDEDGVFMLDYPIRPGVTRVAMAYTVEYGSAALSLDENLRYDIESFTIFATDNEMEVASSSHDLVAGGGEHAAVSWTIGGLKGGDVLNLSFRGGASQESQANAGQSKVIVVPNESESLSMMLMFILLLALLTFTGIALREPHVAGAKALHLEEHRGVLIRRLAKLDDVYETGAIPAAAYHAKRAELKNQVASLIFRLDTVKLNNAATGGKKKARAT